MAESLGKCPICKEGDIIEGQKNFACSNASWKKEGETWENSGCKYSIYKQGLAKLGKQDITADEVKTLLANGTVEVELISKKPLVIDEKYGVVVKWKEN